MDGLTALAHWITPTAGLAMLIAAGVGYALYAHTKSCKEARRELHQSNRQLLAEISELKGYVKGLAGKDS